MAKSIQEMRASGRTSRPTRSRELCLAQGVVAEIQSLAERAEDLSQERLRLRAELRNTDETGAPSGAPRKQSQGAEESGRLAEIALELQQINDEQLALADEMRDHTGTLVLEAEEAGAWRRWADDQPPRRDGEDDAGNPVILAADLQAGLGLVNAGAVLDRLLAGDWVQTWDGEPIGGENWEWLIGQVAPGDIKALVRDVVEMHESLGSHAVGKSRGRSSGTPSAETVSSSPAPSGSPSDDS